MLCQCSVRVMGEVRSYPWLSDGSDFDNCNSFEMRKKKITVETSYIYFFFIMVLSSIS